MHSVAAVNWPRFAIPSLPTSTHPGLPEVNLGVFPPVAAVSFPALIGYNATLRLMLTGETIKAAEALHLGLVHQVLLSRRFLPDAEELLAVLAAQT